MSDYQRLNILVLGADNDDFSGRLGKLVDEIKSGSGPESYSDLATVTIMAKSWGMGPELLDQFNCIDLVYLRTSDGRELKDLYEDAGRIAEAMLVHPNDPWVVLDRTDGSSDPQTSLKRLGMIFRDQGIEPTECWIHGIIRRRLETHKDRRAHTAA